MSCGEPPKDGSPCHARCVVSPPIGGKKGDCTCHCKGEYHGIGYEEFGGADESWKARSARARRAFKLRRLGDEDFDARVSGINWSDHAEVAEVMREADRRDKKRARDLDAEAKHASKAAAKLDRIQATAARRREKLRDETTEHVTNAEAAYRLAEDETNGHMLSRAGQRAGIDPKTLWTGNEARARKYASEELNEFWDKHGRLTITGTRQQRRADARAEQDQHEAEHGPYSHLTYAQMRRQDFDSSVPLSLMDESTVRAGQPMPRAEGSLFD